MGKIDKRVLEEILLDQKEELAIRRTDRLCVRAEQDQIDLQGPQAQVVVGVRRSGKSTLCFQALESDGRPYGYVNFDDERLMDLSAEQLNDVLEVLYKVYGPFENLFLDEIQNVQGWHLFVNRLLRMRMHVLVTGSNAKLLSSDLATHLSGRCREIHLYPFSFPDYCAMKEIPARTGTTRERGLIRAAFDEYMAQGGFPELMSIRQGTPYVRELVRNILQRDVEQRFNVSYRATFESLSNHLLNMAPCVVSVPGLAKSFAIKAPQTVRNYILYLRQAFLLVGLAKFSTKSRLRVTQEKVYPVDQALMNQRDDAFVGKNPGWRLETAVYLQLLRMSKPRGLDIYYLSETGAECDFLICRGNNVIAAIQVSYDICSEKTRKREINGLLKAAMLTGCSNLLLLTDHEDGEERVNDRTIKIRSVYEWVLDSSFLATIDENA